MPANTPSGTTPPQGTPLGQRYVLHEAIGRGAMGRVYRATRRDTGDVLAAKVLHPDLADDKTIVARFVQEGAILTGIQDPRVVRVSADPPAVAPSEIKGLSDHRIRGQADT